jgi:3-keto-disaccharide hydrolase
VALVLLGCTSPEAGPAEAPAPAPPSGTEVVLFNGSSLAGWKHAGSGRFELRDGVLRTHGGMGLLWFSALDFGDFELRLDWRTSDRGDNSGIFVRFPDPLGDPAVAITRGYEVQINDDPGRDPQTSGAIYGVRGPSSSTARPSGEWNSFRIRVTGREYAVWLNGVQVNRFVSTDRRRGLRGHVGLQNHDPDSAVEFRSVRLELLG